MFYETAEAVIRRVLENSKIEVFVKTGCRSVPLNECCQIDLVRGLGMRCSEGALVLTYFSAKRPSRLNIRSQGGF